MCKLNVRSTRVLVVGLVGYFFAASSTFSAELAGRYQLFQGEYRFSNVRGEVSWIRALFKIDTVTGKLFICEEVQIDGNRIGKKGQVVQQAYCKPFEGELIWPKDQEITPKPN